MLCRAERRPRWNIRNMTGLKYLTKLAINELTMCKNKIWQGIERIAKPIISALAVIQFRIALRLLLTIPSKMFRYSQKIIPARELSYDFVKYWFNMLRFDVRLSSDETDARYRQPHATMFIHIYACLFMNPSHRQTQLARVIIRRAIICSSLQSSLT